MFDKLSAELTMLSADRPKMFQGHEQHSEPTLSRECGLSGA
jgi:hypothetical protein